jgi:hypothetical protein
MPPHALVERPPGKRSAKPAGLKAFFTITFRPEKCVGGSTIARNGAAARWRHAKLGEQREQFLLLALLHHSKRRVGELRQFAGSLLLDPDRPQLRDLSRRMRWSCFAKPMRPMSRQRRRWLSLEPSGSSARNRASCHDSRIRPTE